MAQKKSKKNHASKKNQVAVEQAVLEQTKEQTKQTVGLTGPIGAAKESFLKMKNNRKLYFGLVGVLLLILIYMIAQHYGHLLFAARVNNRLISRLEIWQRLEKRYGTQTLDEIVGETLIEQEAARKKVTVTEEKINERIKELEKKFKGKEQLDQNLAFQGMTRDDLKKQIRYQLMVEKMIPEVKVTDKEIQDYYEKNQETLGEELTSEIKTQIKNQLVQEKTSSSFTSWFEKLKKSAELEKYI